MFGIAGPNHLEAQDSLGFFDAALQIADGGDLAEVDANGHQRLRDVG